MCFRILATPTGLTILGCKAAAPPISICHNSCNDHDFLLKSILYVDKVAQCINLVKKKNEFEDSLIKYKMLRPEPLIFRK